MTAGTQQEEIILHAQCMAGSVANDRKQESSVSQVIDFLTPDFRIWSQKGKFATEPHHDP
jgi:hypothetical protein